VGDALPFEPAAQEVQHAPIRAHFLFVPALRVRPGSAGGAAIRFFVVHPILRRMQFERKEC